MTARELARMVLTMRQAQKTYFRTRINLDECKDLERQVDSAVKQVLEGPSLFDREDEP